MQVVVVQTVDVAVMKLIVNLMHGILIRRRVVQLHARHVDVIIHVRLIRQQRPFFM